MDYDLIVVKTLERVYKNYYYIIRGEIRMCEVLDKIENRGVDRGIEIGEKLGETKGEIKALYFYMKKTPDEIGKIINMDEAEVISVIKMLEGRKDI